MGHGPLAFHMAGLKVEVWTLSTVCRHPTLTLEADVEGVASPCPSTQQLGHLLTPGGKAVHMGGSSSL